MSNNLEENIEIKISFSISSLSDKETYTHIKEFNSLDEAKKIASTYKNSKITENIVVSGLEKHSLSGCHRVYESKDDHFLIVYQDDKNSPAIIIDRYIDYYKKYNADLSKEDRDMLDRKINELENIFPYVENILRYSRICGFNICYNNEDDNLEYFVIQYLSNIVNLNLSTKSSKEYVKGKIKNLTKIFIDNIPSNNC